MKIKGLILFAIFAVFTTVSIAENKERGGWLRKSSMKERTDNWLQETTPAGGEEDTPETEPDGIAWEPIGDGTWTLLLCAGAYILYNATNGLRKSKKALSPN
ncbi:MAG: hypothetical protein LBD76_03095 [Prevotellaceae bacterium]|jgi:hypothetical protein|nr:hypothetical protein [Prevotellaceae bacterium]